MMARDGCEDIVQEYNTAYADLERLDKKTAQMLNTAALPFFTKLLVDLHEDEHEYEYEDEYEPIINDSHQENITRINLAEEKKIAEDYTKLLNEDEDRYKPIINDRHQANITAINLAEEKKLTAAYTKLLSNFVFLKRALNVAMAKCNETQLYAAGLTFYTTTGDFTHCFLSDEKGSSIKLTILTCMNQLVLNGSKLLSEENPVAAKKLIVELKADIRKFNHQLGIDGIGQSLYRLGRILLGALGCLIGAVIMILGLTPPGLLISAGCRLFSNHWGPVSGGKKIWDESTKLITTAPPDTNSTEFAKGMSSALKREIIEKKELLHFKR